MLLSRLVAAVAMLCCFRCASMLRTCSAGPQKVVVRYFAILMTPLVYADVHWGAQVNMDKLMSCDFHFHSSISPFVFSSFSSFFFAVWRTLSHTLTSSQPIKFGDIHRFGRSLTVLWTLISFLMIAVRFVVLSSIKPELSYCCRIL